MKLNVESFPPLSRPLNKLENEIMIAAEEDTSKRTAIPPFPWSVAREYSHTLWVACEICRGIQ